MGGRVFPDFGRRAPQRLVFPRFARLATGWSRDPDLPRQRREHQSSSRLYRVLLESGVDVFAFDFRGYGRSEGRPSEEGTYLDAQAAWHWLNQKGFSGRDILVYGESLGGGVASELCVREPTGGLILQSTFTSIPDIGADIYPWLPVRRISSIKYDTHSKLPRIHVPVLVMHSRGDGLIGFGHAERNFKAANEPKLFCEIRGPHNDALEARDQFANGIEKFLQLVENQSGGRR